MNDEFDRLIAEAEAQQMSGWDWSYVEGRYSETEPPWNYREQVRAYLHTEHSLLDLGTGGGELLESLAPLPHDSWATEGYPPNIPIAQARLGPIGVKVVPIEGDMLPLADESFDLVINRHESFDAREVQRVLRPGGSFITQQVGAQDLIELNEALQDEVRLCCPKWEISSVSTQIETAGLQILVAENAFPEAVFMDIGAVVFFLKVTPWQIPDFNCDRYRERLRLLHQRILAEGGFRVHSHRFFIVARKPPKGTLPMTEMGGSRFRIHTLMDICGSHKSSAFAATCAHPLSSARVSFRALEPRSPTRSITSR